MADDDNSTSTEEQEPAPAGETSGSETEPAPAGESTETQTPLEPPDAVSDSSAETDGSSSGSSSSGSKRSSGDSSDSSSSSSDDSSSSSQPSAPPPTEDDVAGALTKALQEHDVPVDDDGVKVTLSSGLYQLMVRLSADVRPLPQVPDDTSNLAPGSVQGAHYLLQGSVQIIEDQVRVNMRVVSVETSEILETSKADASGSVLDAIQGAAGDCLAGLPSLQAH